MLPGRAAADDACTPAEDVVQWIDAAPPDLVPVFGKPGLVVAVGSGDFPAQLRQQGAETIHWDNYLRSRVGLPTTPIDPETIVDRANKLFDYAVQQSGCATPWIAENELSGAGLETPWSTTNAQYRDNVLTYLKALAARGARPFLLVNSAPYTGGEAAAWWQQVAPSRTSCARTTSATSGSTRSARSSAIARSGRAFAPRSAASSRSESRRAASA